jgi:predicted phage terminase large subunit-like protein
MRIRIALHDAQRDVIGRRKRFNVLRCGRRWGKSRLMFALAAEAIYSGKPVSYYAPTYTDFEKRWQEAKQFFEPVIESANEDKFQMRFKGSAAPWDWYGLHRYDGARGNRYALALIDEAAHSRNLERAWIDVIRPTLADFKGSAWFASTPFSGSYFNDQLCKYDDDRWGQFHYPTSTNPYIDAGEIEMMRKDMPSIIFQQEIMADLVTTTGARLKREWIKYGEAPEGASIAFGVDLAISKKTDADFSAIVVSAKHNDSLFVVDVVRVKDSFNATLETIKNLAARYNPHIITIEAVQYQAAMIQELIRTTTLPIKSAHPTKDKVTRFIPVEGKYEHGYVFHSKHLIREFEDELLTFPNGAHDDMCDALAYSFAGHAQNFFAFQI